MHIWCEVLPFLRYLKENTWSHFPGQNVVLMLKKYQFRFGSLETHPISQSASGQATHGSLFIYSKIMKTDEYRAMCLSVTNVAAGRNRDRDIDVMCFANE